MSHNDEFISEFATRSAVDKDRNIQNANHADITLGSQLMLLCTVFLTVTVVVIGNNESILLLSVYGKALLLVGLLSVFLSIAAGVKNFFNLIDFFQKWGLAHHKDYELLRDRNFKTWEAAVKQLNEHNAELSEISSNKWLKWQIRLLFVSGVIFMGITICLLFDFGIR